MDSIHPTVESTEDGSQTLRHPLLGDTYHSLRGARGESGYVFVEQGLAGWLSRHEGAGARVLEMGFGSGLNAYLSALYGAGVGEKIRYEALERYPVDEALAAGLVYAEDPLFGALHRAPWEEEVDLGNGFTLKKRCADLLEATLEGPFDVVYFDAFAPDTQPELWSGEVFQKMYAALAPGGILVTYSAKGIVKQNLRSAGFEVTRLPGALGKRHMLRALKKQ